MAPHSSTLAWKIHWTEEPGRLQSMGPLRVGHDWVTSLSHILYGCVFIAICVKIFLNFLLDFIIDPLVINSMFSLHVIFFWFLFVVDFLVSAIVARKNAWDKFYSQILELFCAFCVIHPRECSKYIWKECVFCLFWM